MIGIEAKLIGALGLAAAALFALKIHDHGIRKQCEADHKAASMAEFQRNAQAIGEIANEAQRLQNRAAADRATLDRASVGLRGAVVGSGLVVRAAAAAASSPTADPSILLADMLDQADRRLRELATEADARGNAGKACQQSYEALTR